MAWKIELLNEAERDIDKLDFQVGRRILKFLYQRVAVLDDPRSIGVALTGVEFGDYRIVCDIQDKKVIVLVLRVGHRREVYR
jgi:mRNA interferase RelE/StbE